MPSFSYKIKSWGAWGPGVDTPEALSAWATGAGEWLSEGKPDVSFMPVASRRRLSLLCKMTLAALYRCISGGPLPATTPSVFASRYGENQFTVSILSDIVDNSLISPMKFSLSTHNSTAGIFSIQARNHAPSVSIAAEEDSFGMALFEAATLLETSDHPEVLVLMSEEPLADMYGPYVSELQVPYAIALVLSATEGAPISTTFESTSPVDRNANTPPLALDFLKWMHIETPTLLRSQGRNYTWTWER
jgi:hypothetical protein